MGRRKIPLEWNDLASFKAVFEGLIPDEPGWILARLVPDYGFNIKNVVWYHQPSFSALKPMEMLPKAAILEIKDKLSRKEIPGVILQEYGITPKALAAMLPREYFGNLPTTPKEPVRYTHATTAIFKDCRAAVFMESVQYQIGALTDLINGLTD